ncbi:NAD-dependent epimerase/dehydratase family protein [Cohnella sp. CFH 77786]|nr:NAD-dependent epimerase/dehydratase family protein [Cohnella sp. CFH 77786]
MNVEGTYNVYEASLRCGVEKVLLCSTMGVYGDSVKADDDRVATVTEDLPSLPGDFYGLTKKLCEEMGEFHSRRHGIQTIAYRLGMFVPDPFVQYGFRLLKGGVDDRDAAQAFLLGLENKSITFDSFNIMADVPFSKEEFRTFSKEPVAFMESRFPGVSDLVGRHGREIGELLQMWGFTYWSIDKAKEWLGYRPVHNFCEFYTALQEGNEAYYPYANYPWWGI